MTDQRETDVCIVGGGPAGIVLGYLLGRCGIQTLVLESQGGFDRDFRGDTLHAGVLEIFDSIGLAEEMLSLPHQKIRNLSFGNVEVINFGWLETEFPFVTMMAQSAFLEFLSEKAKAFPSFQIEMEAKVGKLIYDEQDSETVCGVQYRKGEQSVDVRSKLVIACDGRGSRIRKEANLVPIPVTDLLEVLWFRLPRHESDGDRFRSGAIQGGRLPLILLERPDHYQIAAIIPPGTYSEMREKGLEDFQREIAAAAPDLADRAREALDDWSKIAFLHVEGSRLKTWHKPGLLLIGDAAHVMTPVGGVGINYAIWDAVETANVLVPQMRSGNRVDTRHLAEIQKRRESPVARMQTIQKFAGRQVVRMIASDALRETKIPFLLKLVPRIPLIRSLFPRIIALGGRRTRCRIHEYFIAK